MVVVVYVISATVKPQNPDRKVGVFYAQLMFLGPDGWILFSSKNRITELNKIPKLEEARASRNLL